MADEGPRKGSVSALVGRTNGLTKPATLAGGSAKPGGAGGSRKLVIKNFRGGARVQGARGPGLESSASLVLHSWAPPKSPPLRFPVPDLPRSDLRVPRLPAVPGLPTVPRCPAVPSPRPLTLRPHRQASAAGQLHAGHVAEAARGSAGHPGQHVHQVQLGGAVPGEPAGVPRRRWSRHYAVTRGGWNRPGALTASTRAASHRWNSIELRIELTAVHTTAALTPRACFGLFVVLCD